MIYIIYICFQLLFFVLIGDEMSFFQLSFKKEKREIPHSHTDSDIGQ